MTIKNFIYEYPAILHIVFASLFFGVFGYGLGGIVGGLFGLTIPIIIAIIGFVILISMANN